MGGTCNMKCSQGSLIEDLQVIKVKEVFRKIQCKICYSQYDHVQRVPISLPCYHTICLACVQHLERKECPFDHKPFVKYGKNYQLLSLIQPNQNIPAREINSSFGHITVQPSQQISFYPEYFIQNQIQSVHSRNNNSQTFRNDSYQPSLRSSQSISVNSADPQSSLQHSITQTSITNFRQNQSQINRGGQSLISLQQTEISNQSHLNVSDNRNFNRNKNCGNKILSSLQ